MTIFGNTLFDDKRKIAASMTVVTIVLLSTFALTDQSNNDFLNVGPSHKTKILGIVIDTYPRYWFAMIFGFSLTLLNDLYGMALGPWIMNNVLDPKAITLPYSHKTILAITLIKSAYGHLFSVLTFSMLLSQVDLFAARSLADMLVGLYGTYMYIKDKEFTQQDPQTEVDLPLMRDSTAENTSKL